MDELLKLLEANLDIGDPEQIKQMDEIICQTDSQEKLILIASAVVQLVKKLSASETSIQQNRRLIQQIERSIQLVQSAGSGEAMTRNVPRQFFYDQAARLKAFCESVNIQHASLESLVDQLRTLKRTKIEVESLSNTEELRNHCLEYISLFEFSVLLSDLIIEKTGDKLKPLNTQIKIQNDQISALKAENHSLLSEYAQLKNSAEQIQDKMKQLKKEYSECGSDEIEALRDENQRLMDVIKEMKLDKLRLLEEHKESILELGKLKTVNSDLQNQLESKLRAVSDSEMSLESLRRENERLSSSLESSAERVANLEELQAEKTKLHEVVAQQRGIIKSLKQKSRALEQQVLACTSELEQTQTSLATIKQENKRIISEQKVISVSNEDAINLLKEENERLREHIDAQNGKLQSIASENHCLSEEIKQTSIYDKNLKQENQSLQESLKQAQEKVDEQREMIKKQDRLFSLKITKLQETHDAEKKALMVQCEKAKSQDELCATIKRQTQSLKQFEKEVADLKQEKDAVREKLVALEAEYDSLISTRKQEQNEADAEREELQTRLAKYNNIMSQVRKLKEEFSVKMQEMNDSNASLEAKVMKLREQKCELLTERNEMMMKAKESDRRIREFEEQLSQSHEERAHLQALVLRLNEDMKTLHSSYGEIKTLSGDLERQCATSKSKYDILRQKYEVLKSPSGVAEIKSQYDQLKKRCNELTEQLESVRADTLKSSMKTIVASIADALGDNIVSSDMDSEMRRLIERIRVEHSRNAHLERQKKIEKVHMQPVQIASLSKIDELDREIESLKRQSICDNWNWK